MGPFFIGCRKTVLIAGSPAAIMLRLHICVVASCCDLTLAADSPTFFVHNCPKSQLVLDIGTFLFF
jgi:hypothetical protein